MLKMERDTLLGYRTYQPLLMDALSRSVYGGREFGARAVVVDAISDDAASSYCHFDFRNLDIVTCG
jgi:hypothetical protein